MRLVRYKIIARTGHVNTLQHMVTHCNTMHRIVARARRHVSTLQHTALRCNILHKIGARARHFRFHRIPLSTRSASTLQRTTTHYHTLQHTAIHCNTIQQRHITTSACSCSPVSQTLPTHPSSFLGGGGGGGGGPTQCVTRGGMRRPLLMRGSTWKTPKGRGHSILFHIGG